MPFLREAHTLHLQMGRLSHITHTFVPGKRFYQCLFEHRFTYKRDYHHCIRTDDPFVRPLAGSCLFMQSFQRFSSTFTHFIKVLHSVRKVLYGLTSLFPVAGSVYNIIMLFVYFKLSCCRS